MKIKFSIRIMFYAMSLGVCVFLCTNEIKKRVPSIWPVPARHSWLSITIFLLYNMYIYIYTHTRTGTGWTTQNQIG